MRAATEQLTDEDLHDRIEVGERRGNHATLQVRTLAYRDVMIAYRELARRGISTRIAADLVGIARATTTRKPRSPVVGPAPIPANNIGDVDR